MSRKPKAVPLKDEKRTSQRNPRTIDPQDTAETRKPRAMKAPEADKADPFPEQEDVANTTSANFGTVKAGFGRLSVLFGSSLLALIVFGLGLWFTQLVEDLFARHPSLGWITLALLVTAGISLGIIIVLELVALWRLRVLGRIREDVLRAIEDPALPAQPILLDIIGLYEKRDDMQWHLSRFAAHQDDIIDDRDRLLLAERYLMHPLDVQAQRIITTAAKRVAVITAVNPAASLDVLFTGFQILRMLRQVMGLYGNRPGIAGSLRLAGMVGSHLAVTGGLALSDSLLQQFVGKGLAGRLSAKFGEGMVNGILTARIGIAAMDLCRPMPYREFDRPGLRQVVAMLAGSFSSGSNEPRENGA